MLQLNDVEIWRAESRLFPPVNVQVHAGEVLSVMGPSGCGKSTLLSAIVGDLAPVFAFSGAVLCHDQRVDVLPMEQRKIGLLYQDDLLFPHLNVLENLCFALPAGLSRAVQQERIRNALAEADLVGFESRDIATLSGGQRARVSVLRCLLAEPKAVLLDEPFSRLDVTLRGQFREWVFTELRQRQVPVILVTHDAADCPSGHRYDLLTGVQTAC